MAEETGSPIRTRPSGRSRTSVPQMRRALVGSGMDLVGMGERFRHVLARIPPSVAGMRPPGVTNMRIVEVFWEDIEKARRRGVSWDEIAEELARAGIHKLDGGLFQAATLRKYASRKGIHKNH